MQTELYFGHLICVWVLSYTPYVGGCGCVGACVCVHAFGMWLSVLSEETFSSGRIKLPM